MAQHLRQKHEVKVETLAFGLTDRIHLLKTLLLQPGLDAVSKLSIQQEIRTLVQQLRSIASS